MLDTSLECSVRGARDLSVRCSTQRSGAQRGVLGICALGARYSAQVLESGISGCLGCSRFERSVLGTAHRCLLIPPALYPWVLTRYLECLGIEHKVFGRLGMSCTGARAYALVLGRCSECLRIRRRVLGGHGMPRMVLRLLEN